MKADATTCRRICFRAAVARSFATFVHDDIFKLQPHMKVVHVKLCPRAAAPLEMRFRRGSSVEDAAAFFDIAPSTLARVHFKGELLQLVGFFPLSMSCAPLGKGALLDAAVIAPENAVDALVLHLGRSFDVAVATVRWTASDATANARVAHRLILRADDGRHALHDEGAVAPGAAHVSAAAAALGVDRGDLLRRLLVGAV